MWKLELEDDYLKSRRWYEKKRPNELKVVSDNLDTFFKSLCAGSKPQQVKAKWIHPEPKGVLAVTEGRKAHIAATRLYTYPDETTHTLHLITMGGKDTQPADIKFSTEFVESLRKHQLDQKQNEQKTVRECSGNDPRHC